jgi:hypothetical protein
MKKRKRNLIRRTSEQQSAELANRRELEARIAAITAELEAAGSAYTAVSCEEQLAYAVGRIDAELGRKP